MQHTSGIEAKTGRILFILSFFFLLVLAVLVRMQIFHSDYYRSLSEKNRIRIVQLEAPRGKILDRRGEVMATSRLSFSRA